MRPSGATVLALACVACAPPRPPPAPPLPTVGELPPRGPVTAPASPPPPVTHAVPLRDQRAISATERAPLADDAVRSLTLERCAREARCGNFGPSQRFLSWDACLSVLGPADAVVFGANVCDPGMRDDSRLRACRSAVHDTACNSLLDSLDVLPACQTSNVCRGAPAG